MNVTVPVAPHSPPGGPPVGGWHRDVTGDLAGRHPLTTRRGRHRGPDALASGPSAIARRRLRAGVDSVRLHRAVLHRLLRVRALPARVHGVGLAAPGIASDHRQDDLGRPRQLHPPAARRPVPERIRQHAHDRADLDRAAAPDGARASRTSSTTGLRGRTFFRVSMLMPYATSAAAATIVFAQLFGRDFGRHQLVARRRSGAVNVAVGVWPWTLADRASRAIVTWRWTGYNALDLPRRHAGGPRELYDAAAVDGASRWQQFRHVHDPRDQADDPVHGRRVDDRGDAALRRAPAVRRPARPPAAADHQYQTLGVLLYDQGWYASSSGGRGDRVDDVRASSSPPCSSTHAGVAALGSAVRRRATATCRAAMKRPRHRRGRCGQAPSTPARVRRS